MKILLSLFLFTLVFLATSCSPKSIVGLQGDGINNGKSVDCDPILEKSFEAGLWALMTTKDGKRCSECHTSTGSQSSFAAADPDLNIAFGAFHTPSLPGANIPKIKERMTNNHQGSGDLSVEQVDQSIQLWEDSVKEYDICLSKGQSGGGGGAVVDDPFKAKVFTGPKFMALVTETDPIDVEWDLGVEFNEPELDGVKIRLEVIIDSDIETGDKWYSFKKPRLVANDKDIELESLQVYLNDAPALRQTWKKTHRKVRKTTEQSIGDFELKIFAKDFSTNDRVVLGFVSVDKTVFNPPKLSDLNRAGGVFAESCLQCHSANRVESGVNLTQRNQLVRNGLVVPYDVKASEIYLRMVDTKKPMPVPGNLEQDKIEQIKDWILDGAKP